MEINFDALEHEYEQFAKECKSIKQLFKNISNENSKEKKSDVDAQEIQGNIEALKSAISEKNKIIKELSINIGLKNNSITEKREFLKNKQEEQNGLKQLNQEKDSTIKDLNEQKEIYEKNYEKITGENNTINIEIDNFKKEITQKEETIKNKHQELKDLLEQINKETKIKTI